MGGVVSGCLKKQDTPMSISDRTKNLFLIYVCRDRLLDVARSVSTILRLLFVCKPLWLRLELPCTGYDQAACDPLVALRIISRCFDGSPK